MRQSVNREIVLVADGDEEMRERISLILSKKFEVVAASSGKQCLELAHRNKPQVILLEMLLSDMSGIEICRTLRNDPAIHNCRFIMTSSVNDPLQRIEAFNAGADDYVEKPFDSDELIARVASKMRRVREDCGPAQRILANIILDYSKMSLAIKGGKSVKLGVTEGKILNAMLNADGKVVTRKRLSKDVWGDDTDRVVDPHITSLRKKLSGSNVEIKTVYGEGYCIVVIKN